MKSNLNIKEGVDITSFYIVYTHCTKNCSIHPNN